MRDIYISLGTNLGNRSNQLKTAKIHLEFHGVSTLRESSIYETAPFVFDSRDRIQPWFLNQVIEVETPLCPVDLFSALQKIEFAMGRRPEEKNVVENGVRRYSPRPIDLDLLWYQGRVELSAGGALELPHPRFFSRRYDLVPFAELAPNLVHPKFERTIAELLELCEDKTQVKKVSA